MASQKYIGYVGGLAVAVGVGAAVAVAGQGIAHAETESASSASESAGAVNTGPKKDDTADKTDKADEADAAKDADDSDDKAESDKAGAEEKSSDAKPSLTKKLRQSAQQFEAEQIEKLRSVFTPRGVDHSEPTPKRDNASENESTDEVAEAGIAEKAAQDPVDEPVDKPVSLAAEPVPWSPDPFRPDDPDPDDVPDAVLALRDAILRAPIDPRVKPVIREGIELAYRISQVAPVANVPVPAYKIIPALAEAAQGNKAGAQVIVNQLLLTTQPVALLYYGYDQIADLLNMEYEARDLKQEFYRTAWDTVDPLALLHIRGQHGLRG
ncbi:hypothetical protein [Mycolicibacterium baixiangningiae]|uniref:hypothetical protein n=1 Tax=Mycolicibacterium baixiangningiae TaxID=2761578 RepID=UPI001E60A504|nr:hypothetical protein [Mycolicibacterium baixiangningiae]